MQLYSDKAQLHFGQVLVNLILVDAEALLPAYRGGGE